MFLLILVSLVGILFGVLIGWCITIGTRHRLKHQLRLLQNIVLQVPAGLFYKDLSPHAHTFASHNLALAFGLKTPIEWAHILTVFPPHNSSVLDHAYQKLCQQGSGFILLLSTNTSAHFLIKGALVYSPKQKGILITFQDVSDFASQLQLATLVEQHKNILAGAMDSLSFPLFIRDSKGMTFFANQAVNHEKVDTLNDLNWLSLPFHVGDDFYTLTYGQETKTEEELNRILSNMVSAQRRLCEHLPCAVCLFNASGQLLACSSEFEKLWHLDKKWVQSEPSFEEYLDTVQDNGLLSRVADFADYKRQQRENFACLSKTTDLFIYLPDGKIIHRIMIPYVQGSIILLDEDQTNTKK